MLLKKCKLEMILYFFADYEPITIPAVVRDAIPTRNIFQGANLIGVDDEDLQHRLMRGSRKDPKQNPREQKMGLIVFYILSNSKKQRNFHLKLRFIFYSFEQEQQTRLIVSLLSILSTLLTSIIGPM